MAMWQSRKRFGNEFLLNGDHALSDGTSNQINTRINDNLYLKRGYSWNVGSNELETFSVQCNAVSIITVYGVAYIILNTLLSPEGRCFHP